MLLPLKNPGLVTEQSNVSIALFENWNLILLMMIIGDGYAEPVPKAELGKCDLIWYMFIVGSITLRRAKYVWFLTVVRCMCVTKWCLFQGPNMMNKLIDVLCRFCKEHVAFYVRYRTYVLIPSKFRTQRYAEILCDKMQIRIVNRLNLEWKFDLFGAAFSPFLFHLLFAIDSYNFE